jgi:hypothetical protein
MFGRRGATMADAQLVDLLRWARVRAALDEFRAYLAPHVPPFPLIAANDYWWDDEEYYRSRPEGFPTRMRGVYLMFDAADELLYVGVALVNFDKRVWSHDEMFASWGVERRWTDVIVLPPEYAFLGLSLEYFLICRLCPKCNTSYKGYKIPRCGSGPAEPGAAADGGGM